MRTHRWVDLNHKLSAERRAQLKADAHLELERVGLAAIRKARQQTQVELAQSLHLPQSSISEMERRSDLLLSTLAKYIHALGGELEIRAVFPKATFNLAPPAGLFDDTLREKKPQSQTVKRARRKVA